jgi:hypothetical protein
MEVPLLSGLDNLTELGTRSGIDVRPTLLRVLTDLYVQKPTHTRDEDRQYTELALRLMEAVDVATRASVAARLAAHPSAPIEVLARLYRSLPQQWRGPDNSVAAAPPSSIEASGGAKQSFVGLPKEPAQPTQSIKAADELNDIFFSANAEERRLILLNLEVVGPPAPRRRISRDPLACERLEATALARKEREFAQHLARSLHIASELALQIVRDQSGEPIVVAAKTLHMSGDMLQRILLFLNSDIGQSVARVHTLARLYDEITTQAAEHMLALWQSLHPADRTQGAHQSVVWRDQDGPVPHVGSTTSRSHAPTQITRHYRNAS